MRPEKWRSQVTRTGQLDNGSAFGGFNADPAPDA